MNISDFISNVGFPIAICCYFIYNQTQLQKQNKEEILEMQNQHKEEMQQVTNIMSEAINNNTAAITELKRSVDEWKKKE